MADIYPADLLEGAAEIAEFLYGSSNTRRRRRVFYLAERRFIPIFRMGETICARRSTLTRWMSEQECKTTPTTEELVTSQQCRAGTIKNE